MSGILSYVTRSEIMKSAHDILAENRRYGERLAYNARTIAWQPNHARALADFRPMSFSDALKSAWRHARHIAEQRRLEASVTAEAIRLREIELEIEILEACDRWTSADYDTMHTLRAAQTAAREAALAVL